MAVGGKNIKAERQGGWSEARSFQEQDGGQCGGAGPGRGWTSAGR